MPSISATISLRSSDSSLSNCSDISVDTNFYDRAYIEDTQESLLKGHLHESSKLNGFHQLDNIVKNDAQEVKTVDDLEPPTNLGSDQVHERVVNNAERDELNVNFWLPPEPVDKEDDITSSVTNYDDDDDDECGDGATWAEPSSLSSFGEETNGSYKFKEERLKGLNEVRNGKFMALVTQLIKSVGLDSSEDWVDIVTSLSWEAASFVKPDTHEGKAMDPDGYVKVKCVGSGLRTQSRVVKGLVFKKHAAHKHMPTKYKNARLLLIHGSLDLSSGGLSSFESMQQEKDNLNTIVEMIKMYHPNVVLVEKSVSRDIQESILAKGMTLVFDMKLHRLERVARCIGSSILSSEVSIGQLRQCDSFHIEKFVEEHTVAGKKLSKTLMFLEGAPSRLGCTILLMGANSDELKRIKCVIRCAVVMAYHLMLETSFLLDQTAMFSTISSQMEFDAKKIDIPSSNGFYRTNEVSSSSDEEESPQLFQSYKSSTFPGLSLSTSIQKVMNDSFPIFSESIPHHLGFDEQNHNDNSRNNPPEVVDCDDDNPKVRFDEENLDISNHNNNVEDGKLRKDEISAALDSESILVLVSSRNASRETICEQSHFSHIKFYKSFDVPLGKFLGDNLLNPRLECKTCGESPVVHFFYYAHHNKQLTIQVRHIHESKRLPGGNDGKLWMWSRCGQCKFDDGNSRSTKRVLISTTARGLSFGKFLELSFSNHSSFNSSSSCGHSFHKDFLYFFGLGPMVAMFKYSPVETYTVSLPAQRMEFKSSIKGEFLMKDFDNVYSKGTSMFLDIGKSLKHIGTRYVGVNLNIHGSSKEFSDIVEMLELEKSQFEVDIQSIVKNESEGDIVSKLLSLNRVRLELLLESCVWDRRLHALRSSDLKVIETQEQECKEANTEVGNGDSSPKSPSGLEHNSVELPKKEFQVEKLNGNRYPIHESIVEPCLENHATADEVNSQHVQDWIWSPFTIIQRDYMDDLQRGYLPKIESFNSYAAESVAHKLITDEGSRLHIPLGNNKYIVSDYEDEFSSIIACALTLLKDISFPSEELTENARSSESNLTRVFSFPSHNSQWSSLDSVDSVGLESHTSSFDGLDLLDSLVSYSASHPEVSMGLGKYQTKRKYSVVCLFASQFHQLRDRCCPSEVDYIASLSRCRNWDAKGGKSKSFFAKTLDDRFIIKEIKRTEFDSFMKFATNYFEYMNQCYELGNQTCLAKILGIYQVVVRAPRNGKETRHDLLVMENLSFGRNIVRQYDLKGALHARFNSATNNSGDVLLDQNFVNDMNVSPLYVSRKSKRHLQRAIYNDTNFLNLINVMDYSLLVGVDTQRRELTCGIIDYLRQYTWDKQLENWVKSSLVVPKNQLPTIISPKEYKKRFRKFISTHFLTVPDHWCQLCGPTIGNGSLSHTSQKQGKLEGTLVSKT